MRWFAAMLLILCTTVVAQTTQSTRQVLEEPLPPAAEFSKRLSPIARRYDVSVPAKSFAELRALRYGPDGHLAPADVAASEPLRFSVFVPTSYGNGDKPFGLMVWIEPEIGVQLRDDWCDVLDKHEMIFIAPQGVPNESHSVWRMMMAIESVHLMQSQYNIDRDRVYIAGMSGGGRISSHAGVFFPDIFSGALCIVGSNFYRNVPAGNRQIYPGFWPHPIDEVIEKGRANSRLVLLTGTRDFNLPSTKAAFDAYQADRWKYVTYLEVPDMGHQRPPPDWFEKAIEALDEPLAALAGEQFDRAANFEKDHKLGEACLAYESAARHGADQSFVPRAADRAKAIRTQFTERLNTIHKAIDLKQFDPAISLTRKLKDDFGPLAADEAQKLFDQIREKRKQK